MMYLRAVRLLSGEFGRCSRQKLKLKPVLNWANVCSPEHTSDTSTNYDSFLKPVLNWANVSSRT